MHDLRSVKRESGFGLTEVLVAIAVLGLAVMIWMSTMGQSLRLNQSIKVASERDELASFVLNSVSCPATLAPPSGPKQCTAVGQPVKLYDFAGNLFPTTINNRYQVRARCDQLGGPVTPNPVGVLIEALRISPDGSPATDPLRPGVAETWKPLFDPGLSPCARDTQPEVVTVTNDLKMDPVALFTVIAWAASGGAGPVNLCADSYPDLWQAESTLVYEGAAACPRGYSVISGGVDCSMEMGVASGTDPVAPLTSPTFIRRRAWKTNSSFMPKKDLPLWARFDFLNQQIADAGDSTDTWFGGCCVTVNTLPISGINIPLLPIFTDLTDRVYARCKRDLPM